MCIVFTIITITLIFSLSLCFDIMHTIFVPFVFMYGLFVFIVCRHSVLCVFLPCDAMRCTVLVIVILSVCLSVTLVDCVHMVRPTITISSPYGSHMILVSRDIAFIPKFEGGHPREGVE